MSPEVLATLLVLFSAVAHATVNIMTKAGTDPLVRRTVLDGTSGLLMAPVVFFVPLPDGQLWLVLALSVTIHMIYFVLMINSYRLGDFSVVYPVARGLGPVLTAAGAFLVFDERLSGIQVGALVAASFGIMLFALDGARTLFSATKERAAFLFAAGTAVTIAVTTVIDATGTRSALNPWTFIAWFFVLDAIFLTAGTSLWRGSAFLPAVKDEWRSGMIAGVLSLIGYTAFLLALRLSSVAELAALRETSILFGALFGTLLLNERFGAQRLVGAIVITLGVIVLRAV